MLHSHYQRATRHRAQAARRGVTLVEMLVSVTITLLVVFAIVQVFDLLGETMAKGRATIEMAGNLRTVANRLQADLDNLTCPVEPWIDPAAGLGYFKYIEGVNGQTYSSDQNADADGTVNLLDDNGDGLPNQETSRGDTDDLLMFTARSDEPFTGRDDRFDLNNFNGFDTIEANVAEVIWWVTQVTPNGPLQLHRRALLVRPDLNGANGLVFDPSPASLSTEQLRNFLNTNDISVRVVTSPETGKPIGLAANSLADLTTPRNRFGHYPLSMMFGATPTAFTSIIPAEWPAEIDPRYLTPLFMGAPHDYHLVLANWPNVTDRRGDDVVLSDVLAFDVKVYDAQAPLYVDAVTNVALAPHEPGYDFAAVNAAIPGGVPQGAFVDLFYTTYAGSAPIANFNTFDFASPPAAPSGVDPWFVSYDTWSIGMERDGIDQNPRPPGDPVLVDEGFDGVDNPDIVDNVTRDGVDDYGERETRPPYNVPLTGIEVKIRAIEFGTRQVRQTSVVGDFTD